MYYNLEHFKLFLFVFFSVHSLIITPSHSVTLFRFRSLSYLLLLSLYTKCVSTTIVGTPRATHPPQPAGLLSLCPVFATPFAASGASKQSNVWQPKRPQSERLETMKHRAEISAVVCQI